MTDAELVEPPAGKAEGSDEEITSPRTLTENGIAVVNKDLKDEVRTYRLRDRLIRWTPWDEAAWYLGRSIGLFPGFTDYATFRDKIGSMWTRMPDGNALYGSLDQMAVYGILEKREARGDFQFRWRR